MKAEVYEGRVVNIGGGTPTELSVLNMLITKGPFVVERTSKGVIFRPRGETTATLVSAAVKAQVADLKRQVQAGTFTLGEVGKGNSKLN